MKIRRCLLFGLLNIMVLSAVLRGLPQSPSADWETLLDQVAKKIKAYPDYNSWRASAITKIIHMDKDWAPEKITIVTKNIKVVNGERDEEILKATETIKGKIQDITAKYAERARKEREKARQRRVEAKEGRSDQDEGGRSISLDDLLPFAPQRRGQFEFRRSADVQVNGRTAAVLEARSKLPDKNNWDGTYFIDAETFDLLRVEARPSKNPAMVKEMGMQIDLEILGGRYLGMKKTVFTINGGFFIKHIRMVVEEEYSNLEVIE